MVVGPKEVPKRQSPPFEVIDYSGTTWPTPPGARGHFPNRLAHATCGWDHLPKPRGHFPGHLAHATCG
jgi:hypothetical protein